jgi:hypothetical protein
MYTGEKQGRKVNFGRPLTPKETAMKEYKEHVEKEPNPNSIVALRSRIEKLEQIVFTHIANKDTE